MKNAETYWDPITVLNPGSGGRESRGGKENFASVGPKQGTKYKEETRLDSWNGCAVEWPIAHEEKKGDG